MTPVSIPPDPYQRALKDLRLASEELREANERIKRLEQENDDMREDLLMWGDTLRLQQRINKLEQENDSMRADLLLWGEKEVKL